MKADLAVRHAGRLVTCAGGGTGLGVIEDAALLAADGLIAWLGPESDLPAVEGEPLELDAGGGAVLPGLIDCHTHLVFAGERSEEFAARMRGEAYAPGGIRSTVRATRATVDDELRRLALDRLDRFLALGVTTLEAKTGYGLGVEEEIRLLAITAGLGHPVDVVATLLGAHALPEEFEGDPDAFVQVVCEDMIPAAGEAMFCDAWCDQGAFTVDQCRRVLEAGRAHGLRPKLHAEQLGHSGGARLAAELRAVSADHLEHADEADARALAEAGVVAVLLPGASLMTRSRPAPARLLADAGAAIALATDLNPGTSYSENLPLMVALGCAQLGLTVEESILGVTANAAAAIGDEGIGRLQHGMRCDLLLLAAEHEADLAYHYGVNLTAAVVKDGRSVHRPPA